MTTTITPETKPEDIAYIHAKWFITSGFYVQRVAGAGAAQTGFLTDRGGFAGRHLAECFHTLQDAIIAANKACNRYQILKNVKP